MNTLQELQQWYREQCDGDWEHSYGVKIGTLDNPGWRVTIDLTDTKLAGRPFSEIRQLEHEVEWIQCGVRDGRFEACGGPSKLEDILHIFLAWSREPQITGRVREK